MYLYFCSDFKKLFGGKLKSCILSVEQPSTIQHFIKATLGISLVTGLCDQLL